MVVFATATARSACMLARGLLVARVIGEIIGRKKRATTLTEIPYSLPASFHLLSYSERLALDRVQSCFIHTLADVASIFSPPTRRSSLIDFNKLII